MAIKINVREGEDLKDAVKRFKKMCDKEGVLKDIKRVAHYEKPSERRRRLKIKAQRSNAQSKKDTRSD